jgi:hypothetical protein
LDDGDILVLGDPSNGDRLSPADLPPTPRTSRSPGAIGRPLAAAAELRGFACMRQNGIVPLLVVVPGGLWATMWSPPDFGVAVCRV